MRKICKYCLTLVAILASTNAWAQGLSFGFSIPYYAKVSAHVSSNCRDGGVIFVYSKVWVNENATTIEEACGYNDPIPTPEDANYEEMLAWVISQDIKDYEDERVYELYDILNIGSTQPDTAWLFAFPKPGYYFKGWSQKDKDYELGGANPITRSILTQAFPDVPIGFDDEGNPFIADFPTLPKEEDIPSIGTFYATFKPVLVNSGEDIMGSITVGETAPQNFSVHFSTSFGTIENDFETPAFENGGVVAGCGTFAFKGFTYTKETGDVTVSVTFTPATQMLEGTYSCPLTFASKGGSSIKANVGMEVEAASAIEAVVKNGEIETEYTTFIKAWLAAADGDTIILKKNVELDAEINNVAEQIGTTALPVTKNITLDLNGKTLTGSKPQMIAVVGGKLTIMDSKKTGKIQHNLSTPGQTVVISAGSVVMNGGTISLNSEYEINEAISTEEKFIMRHLVGAVLVYPGIVPEMSGLASFMMNDGIINANGKVFVGGVINYGGTITINAGEVHASGFMGVITASNLSGTLNILGGNLKAELQDGSGSYEEKMAYGVLAFGGTTNIEKAKIIAKAGNDLTYDLYGVCCPQQGITTIRKKATIGIEYIKTSNPNYAHESIGAMYVQQNVATAILDGAKLYAHGNNGYTEEFSSTSTPTIKAAYFATRNWVDNHYTMGEDQALYDVSAGKEYLEGYRYFLGDAGTAKDNGTAVCKIGNMGYATLEDALFYAQNNLDKKVIITMVNDYTLPAGWYTLPSNASLLVPYCAEQTALMGKNVHKLAAEADPTPPSPYRTLTMESGVHLDVFGSIEVSCIQRIEGIGAQGCAVPDGPFGWIKMEQGSEMTLNGGSHLYAWGFITGKGEIEARRGCTVHEDFQVYDWPGGSDAIFLLAAAYGSSAGAFPINQYFMQNIECPVTYHPGSHMYASFGATAAGFQVAADEIGIVGVNEEAEEHPAMFLMNDNADADNTWVRKYYDTETDQQVYEVNSGAHLGSMVIDIPLFKLLTSIPFAKALLGGVTLTGFDSRTFVLPITSNMKLHLLSGMMDITQNTEFLPGSELEVNKTSTMIVRDEKDIVYDGRVIFVDDDDWMDGYAYGGPYHQIAYSPTFDNDEKEGKPNIRDIKRDDSSKIPVGDAKLNVHGTFQVDGYLLTTQGGATIFSNNEDAGTIIFPNEIVFNGGSSDVAAPTGGLIEYAKFLIENGDLTDSLKKVLTNMIYVHHLNETAPIELKSALLRNTEGQTPAFENTGSDDKPTRPGESYCFLRDRWTRMKQFDENFAYDNHDAWYVKPGEYVAIATTEKVDEYFEDADASTQPLENEDHTYSDANGEGRLFILVYNEDKGGWQCWEVTIQDNLYRGTNGTYYHYDESQKMWMEKTFSVTWKNWNGETLKDADGEEVIYNLYYGIMPKYNGTNPSRVEEEGDYTYTFTGWTPEIVPVHEDAIYTATYERSPRKYTIIFEAENGEEIERHFYTKGEMPECEDVPHKVGYYLQWEPSLGAVKGDATYRATFLPEKPIEFDVTFVNYDGTELHSEPVAVGTTPEYSGIPEREPSDEYTYEFARWSPALKPVDAAITYTAVFNEKPREYEIKFFKEGGLTQIGETQNLPYGAVPIAPNYSKKATAEYTYTTVWNPTITAVTENSITHTYTARIDSTKNKYTVTVNAIGCVVTGAGVYEYNETKLVRLQILGALEGYENPQWEDDTTDDYKEITVTGNVTYTATATPVADKTLVVEDGETLTLTDETRVAAFTIQANSETSGQVFGAENIELMGAGKAYFEYDFDAQAMKWYAFAVPFVCDANTLRNENRTLQPGVDYDIMAYNGAIRATAGADRSAWEYISDKGINVLTPGHLYMILFAQAQKTAITFTKTASASINYTTPVTINQYPAADELDANWNGVANPKLFYAKLGTGVTDGQIYVTEEDRYDMVKFSETTFPVGKPVFVQANNAQSVIVTPVVSAAPLRRMLKADKQECEINLMQGNKECDNLSIIMNDDAEDRYVIGEDLAKAGVSTKVAQMWVNRYNAKLCVNSIAAEDEVATYPLGIFAPKAGAYTIAAASVPANTAVYLTEDDNIIADLTAMPYMLDLSKGTHNEFSLRMVGKTQPSVVTDFQEASINGKDVQKVIKNNTLYILRADKVFNAQGQLVK